MPDPYDSFKRKQYLDTDLNEHTEKVISLEKEQIRKRREQQHQIAFQQARNRTFKPQKEFPKSAMGSQTGNQHYCNDNYSDCH